MPRDPDDPHELRRKIAQFEDQITKWAAKAERRDGRAKPSQWSVQYYRNRARQATAEKEKLEKQLRELGG